MRFSIRGNLWLTILVAITVAWWLDHRANLRTQKQLRLELFAERVEQPQKSVAKIDERVRDLTSQVRKAQLEAAKSEYENMIGPSPCESGNGSP